MAKQNKCIMQNIVPVQVLLIMFIKVRKKNLWGIEWMYEQSWKNHTCPQNHNLWGKSLTVVL